MLKLFQSSAIALLALVSGGGCVTLGHPGGFGPMGALFSYTEIGVSGKKIDSKNSDLRIGKACTTRLVVPLAATFAYGSGTVAQAARQGNIRTIHTVNRELLSVLMLWTRMCTVVTGTFDEPPSPSAPIVE